jgi:hypothetical protein
MPDKSEAFDEVFNEFYSTLGGRLASDGMAEFVWVFDASIGRYLDCAKDDHSTDDLWQNYDFRHWGLVSAMKVGKAVKHEAKGRPATREDVDVGAAKVFDAVNGDPTEFCNKAGLPHCEEFAGSNFGPVCELYFAARDLRRSEIRRR